MPNTTQDEQTQTLQKIINSAHTAFLVTRTTAGALHGRPMATAELKKDLSEIWFATQRDSGKVEELAADDHVFLGYAGSGNWASVTGHGQIVDDRAKMHELWTPIWKNWFTGPDDPKLTLIRVTPDGGEYWNGGSSVVMMAKLAFTAVTGKALSPADHASVAL